jgi:hypothetical protein
MKTLFAVPPLILILLALPASGLANTLYFDEFGTTTPLNVDGLYVAGVTFHFSGGPADYNGAIGTPGTTALVNDPVLTGSTGGTLTLTFDNPMTYLQFDMALLSMAFVSQAYTVALSTGEVIQGSAAPVAIWSEGTFQYRGPAVTSAEITFFHGVDLDGAEVPNFALDNLTYHAPEPGTLLLIAGGLLAMGVIGRRRIAG